MAVKSHLRLNQYVSSIRVRIGSVQHKDFMLHYIYGLNGTRWTRWTRRLDSRGQKKRVLVNGLVLGLGDALVRTEGGRPLAV